MARDFARCIAALNKAAGRELTPEEVQDAFDRIHRTALDLKAGRIEPGDGNLSTPEGIVQHAARLEAQKMIADADLKARRAVMDAETHQRLRVEVQALKAGGLNGLEAIERLLVNRPDGKADAFSLETRYHGITKYMQSKIQDTWIALGDGFIDYLQRPDKARLLIREMKGEDTGDALAKKGAQAWLKLAEEGRQWFNDKGGKVGRLEDWGLPQHHSQDLVARAAGGTDRAANQKAWVDAVLPLIDRSRYTDLAGRRLDEAAMRSFLGAAWDTIATGGVNKLEPGQFKGKGARSNRHADERSIHFKDADALLTYWERFGDRTLPDILMGHVDSMAKDIAFLEHFGANPNATYALLRDEAIKAHTMTAPTDAGKVESQAAKLDRLYEYAAGITKPVADQRVANAFSVVHALNTAGRLGSAFWASLIGDKVMFEALGRVNNLPPVQLWYNELRLLNPANAGERRVLRRQALMLDYMTQAMHRFGDELGKSSLSAKLANTVMKVSGMSAVNEWRRGAWALTAMDAIGHEVSTKNFADIGPQDMRLLQSYGITEADWNIWKNAKLIDLGHGNDTALTPAAIMRIPDDLVPLDAKRDAMVKFLGALTAESHNAVIEPGWRERAQMYGGLQRGNIRDEITRSFWQFKAFPLTQFHKILDIGMSRPTTGGKAGFLSSMPVMLTMAGAMMIQVQEMLAGKDPRPMDDWKFWGAAFLKGGTLGIYGDFLFSNQGETRYGTGPLEAVAGPTIGAAADIATILAKAPGQIRTGEEPRIAAKVLQTLKGFVPFQNLWYTKAATDHLIFQNAQEAINPGYLENMRRRTEREYGQDWWWRPGQVFPDRGPDVGGALGR